APEAFRSLALTFGERLAALDPEAHRQVSAAMAAQALAGQRWPEHVALLTRAVEQQDWPAVKFLAGTLASQMEQWSANVAPASRRPLVPATPSHPAPFADTLRETEGRPFLRQNTRDALPASGPAGARQKIAGEIFRELDLALRQDPELLEQVRDSVRGALRSGYGRSAIGRSES